MVKIVLKGEILYKLPKERFAVKVHGLDKEVVCTIAHVILVASYKRFLPGDIVEVALSDGFKTGVIVG